MGDRAQIISAEDEDSEIYLYTHWGGEHVPQTLAAALDRGRSKWNDPAYLNRIIFCEMIKDDVDGETGFGISNQYQDSSPQTDWYVCYYGRWAGHVRIPGGQYIPFHEFVEKYLET